MPIYSSAIPSTIPSTLKLVEYPSASLLKVSTPVDFENKLHMEFIKEMLRAYYSIRRTKGSSVIGLAAPQVGKNIRVFIAFGEIYINPQIIWTPKEGVESSREGCLSLPAGMFWEVTRPYSCILGYSDLEGVWQEKKFNNINARAIMHEMDHLDGKLCCGTDYPLEKTE